MTLMGHEEDQSMGGSVMGSDQGGVYLLSFHSGNQTVIPSTQVGAGIVTINIVTEARWLGLVQAILMTIS